MLENVVRFVVALLVPAAEKAAVAGMVRDFAARLQRGPASQFFYETRNPLAFGHPGLNLLLSEMRGKPARLIFLHGERGRDRGRGAE